MTPTARTPRRHLSVAPREDVVYILRITLKAVDPPVWRRVQVVGSMTLERLDMVIQKAMGWRNVHLHEFEVDGRRYGQPVPDEPHYKVEPEWKLTLRAAAPAEGARFRYLYDLGDGWGHEVLRDRAHPEHRDMLAWVGRGFDPERFDRAAVNRKLRLIAAKIT